MTPREAHRSQAGPIYIPVYRDDPLKRCSRQMLCIELAQWFCATESLHGPSPGIKVELPACSDVTEVVVHPPYVADSFLNRAIHTAWFATT